MHINVTPIPPPPVFNETKTAMVLGFEGFEGTMTAQGAYMRD